MGKISLVGLRPLADCPSGRAFKLSERSMKAIHRFIEDESGATAIEYRLLAAGISLAIISSVSDVGSKLSTKFASISTSLR